MNKGEWKAPSVDEISSMLEKLGASREYDKWILTAPICLDFELCRTETADLSLCCALLTAILREDHFDNGCFEKRVRSGAVAGLLERIEASQKEPLQKSPPWFSPDELWQARCTQVPGEAGVYYVLLHNGEPKFREDPRGGYDPKELKSRWERSGGKCLYIGKASGKKGLRGRLWQYLRYGYANGKNHRGGRAIWQVEQREELRFSWQVCPEAYELERELLRRYYEVFHCYPVANRRN